MRKGASAPFFIRGDKVSKTTELLKMFSMNEATADFCEKNSPQYIDDECGRINFYSSRWSSIMRPTPEVKNVIDFDQSAIARVVYNLKKIGVIFDVDKPFYQKVGHGHISLRIDGTIKQGYPDFPNEKGLLFVRRLSKAQFSAAVSGNNGLLDRNAHLLMAIGGFKKSSVIYVCDQTGEISAQVVELNLVRAHKIYETVNNSVSSISIPERINNDDKCSFCPFAKYCILPDSPSPTCRNCVNFVIGENGYAACNAQNGKLLSVDEQVNLHKCQHHLYMSEFLDSWAEYLSSDIEGGNEYANKITGEVFVNHPSGLNGSYTSYEIYGASGKDLIGSKKIDKIRKMFDAKIEDD